MARNFPAVTVVVAAVEMDAVVGNVERKFAAATVGLAASKRDVAELVVVLVEVAAASADVD